MVSESLEETYKIAADFVDKLKKGEAATVVALSGDLGAGKTSFTQGVAKALSIEGPVQSPTFVIEKVYEAKHAHFKRLVHIDCYRLESPDELARLRFDETVSDPDNLILIEWPERVAKLIPDDAKKIHLRFIDEERREIDLISN